MGSNKQGTVEQEIKKLEKEIKRLENENSKLATHNQSLDRENVKLRTKLKTEQFQHSRTRRQLEDLKKGGDSKNGQNMVDARANIKKFGGKL